MQVFSTRLFFLFSVFVSSVKWHSMPPHPPPHPNTPPPKRRHNINAPIRLITWKLHACATTTKMKQFKWTPGICAITFPDNWIHANLTIKTSSVGFQVDSFRCCRNRLSSRVDSVWQPYFASHPSSHVIKWKTFISTFIKVILFYTKYPLLLSNLCCGVHKIIILIIK